MSGPLRMPNPKPITSRSGITEQSAPITQTRFGVRGLVETGSDREAATAGEKTEAIWS
jgi:hypothetical protein